MQINATPFQLKLKNPFGISRSTRTTSEIVLVEIDGGLGEATPIKFYKEDTETVLAALEKIGAVDVSDLDYLEDVMDRINEIVPGDQSAKAAVDIALHDRLAKKLGVPLYKLFGRAPDRKMVTSFTIGIDTTEEMLRKVDEARDYAILKIKLGREINFDINVMQEIRKAVGGKILRVDANCGWTLDEARRAVRAMADLGVEYVEQPLEKGSFEALRDLHKDAPLPIFVDEDSIVNADLPKLAGAVDGINIKLMKSGGLVEARRMVATARAFGFQVMLGCMLESGCAIAAAAHLAPHCDNLDLDGNLLVSNDPFTGLVTDADGTLHLPDSPGLGIAFKPEAAELKSSLASAS